MAPAEGKAVTGLCAAVTPTAGGRKCCVLSVLPGCSHALGTDGAGWRDAVCTACTKARVPRGTVILHAGCCWTHVPISPRFSKKEGGGRRQQVGGKSLLKSVPVLVHSLFRTV